MTVATELIEAVSTTIHKSVPNDLRQLLDHYKVLFEVPKGLPPPRAHDHKIPLVNELHVVKMRPYRYPSIQKDKIEKMIGDMKEAGIIRDSTSSFASPIVLVKKKDGGIYVWIIDS